MASNDQSHPPSEAVSLEELGLAEPEVFRKPSGDTIGIRYDIRPLLEDFVGPDWQERTCSVIDTLGEYVVRNGDHGTVREPIGRFGLVTVTGSKFAEAVPGVWKLYRGVFKAMMQASLPEGLEPLHAYDNPEYGLEPVGCLPMEPGADADQRRYEAHVDQRYTAVLFLRGPSDSIRGGRLVIANQPNARSIEEIDADSTLVEHLPGTLFGFSSGRFDPHYTEVVQGSDTRYTTSLNFPVEGETSEAAREILDHAYGRPT